ncbi:MAG: putative DNA binding domain-containing protein [Planctomycetes bacterium]|nr:putative DNA binding domain-containing protein [Planctomycetota bacterium]
MTIDEALKGESDNVEFKEALPANAEQYLKTVIAFANSQGGTLIIGIGEGHRVVGVDPAAVFPLMDSIANAVSDSCQPQIVPEIEPHTVDGQTLIIVTVAPGPNRPYHLKAKGRERGTYIRVGATSRPASPDKIIELEMEGRRVSWDEQPCLGCPATDATVAALCAEITRRRHETHALERPGVEPLAVTPVNLENWNVLKKTEGGHVASNAFALLTGEFFPYAKTQCAVFAGTDRGEFIDKQEYSGPLPAQIEAAYAFVLRNIRRSARVKGLIRRERYELPPQAIREMIINAHCHRNFQDEACVQVALYDDRLEVTSPGGLYFGLTLDEALNGRSRQRNRAIAAVFSQMGLIEAWGNGLRSIRRAAQAWGLPTPEFFAMPNTFRVNLYRRANAAPKKPGTDTKTSTSTDTKTDIKTSTNTGKQATKTGSKTDIKASAKTGTKTGTSTDTKTDIKTSTNTGKQATKTGLKTDTKNSPKTGTKTSTKTDTKADDKIDAATSAAILPLLRANPAITLDALAQQTGLSRSGVRYVLNQLRNAGIVRREGTRKFGRWVVKRR